MKPFMYVIAVETFAPQLRRLIHIIEKAEIYAADHSIDSQVWMTGRLAPDMFTFARQVQAVCDHAKDTVARLMGKEPPQIENTEETLEQLRARVDKTLEFIEAAPQSAFEGAESHSISRPLPNNRVLEMPGLSFVKDWALPQFYFHLVTAYGILLHNGVDLGKRDYLTDLWSAVRRRDT
jgi:uncharacterized protein